MTNVNSVSGVTPVFIRFADVFTVIHFLDAWSLLSVLLSRLYQIEHAKPFRTAVTHVTHARSNMAALCILV